MDLKENFEWLTPEFKLLDAGKNKIRIRGVALHGNVVSRNNRHYVKEELIKSARTWVGKPVTINHNDEAKIGTVIWAEYSEESEALEYLADINKQPYVQMIRDGSTKIKGVSVQANYLHNRCPKCDKRFYSETDFSDHMYLEHFIKTDPTKEPHGMIGSALSLVLSPEEPGYTGTTIELMETWAQSEPILRLLETVTKTKLEEVNYMEKIAKAGAALSTSTRMAVGKHQALKEQAKQCEEGYHWDEESQTCIKDTEPETEAEETADVAPPTAPNPQEDPVVDAGAPPKCPLGTHYVEGQGCVPDMQPNVGAVPAVAQTVSVPAAVHPAGAQETSDIIETIVLPTKLKLGEPFSGYSSFEDCTAKNQDKDDPAAHCSALKNKIEGEGDKASETSKDIYETQTNISRRVSDLKRLTTERDILQAEATNKLNEAVASTYRSVVAASKNINSIRTQLNTLDNNMRVETINKLNGLQESLSKDMLAISQDNVAYTNYVQKKMTEHVEPINKNVEALKTELQAVTERINSYITKQEDTWKKLDEIAQERNKIIEDQATKIQALETKSQEKEQKQVTETADLDKKLSEMNIKLDNLEDKLRPNFKGVNPTPQQTTSTKDVYIQDPITKGDN